MASAAAAFGARFRRGHDASKAEPRVGEILSDSSEGSASMEIAPRAGAADRSKSSASMSSTESRGEGKKAAPAVSTRRSKQAKRAGSRKWFSDSDSDEEGGEYAKVSAAASMAARNSPRDDEDKDGGGTVARGSSPKLASSATDGESKENPDVEELDADSNGSQQPVVKEQARLKRLTDLGGGTPKTGSEADTGGVLSPLSDSETPRSGGGQAPGKKQTSFQKLMAKTKTLSPFAARNKGLEGAAGPSPLPTTRGNDMVDDSRLSSASASASGSGMDPSMPSRLPSGGAQLSISQRRGSKLQVTTNLGTPTSTMIIGSDIASPGDPPTSTNSTGASDGPTQAPMPIINRRTSRLKQSPSHSDYGATGGNTPRSGDMSPAMPTEAAMRRTLSYETPDSMSPGQRKQPGAFPGHPGSGVLLEGWLRQKQRRGMKGMKKWNSRYFVLYAKTNEVRYYADVVPSAWGPIPLGEIGSISLRLIQRIGKPSHPKYKGCRFDITCRNTWGTHYADDYVSSDDENNNNNNDEAANNGANTGGKPEKSGTPKSSRVYSLIADSPQVTVTWVNTLDSLLTRSANSPRPDVNSPSTGSKLKKMPSSKTISRRRSSALDMETVVLCGPQDTVPRAVTYSIHYIFNSSPGVEMPHFYELDADAAKLKVCLLTRYVLDWGHEPHNLTNNYILLSLSAQSALKFLNHFAEGDGSTSEQKPTKEELSSVLDPVTAGAVVRTWLQQLEQPLIPFEMFPDFKTLAANALTEKFELSRNLKALLDALPPKNRYVLFNCYLWVIDGS